MLARVMKVGLCGTERGQGDHYNYGSSHSREEHLHHLFT